MFKLRHALIPACISFGPLFMSRIGGLITDGLGVSIAWVGVALLTCGLYLMFELLAGQQAFIEKLKIEQSQRKS